MKNQRYNPIDSPKNCTCAIFLQAQELSCVTSRVKSRLLDPSLSEKKGQKHPKTAFPPMDK